MTQRSKIAIIGAGIAGLHVARALAAHADVQVFEKSRGLGGRMSTRRAGAYRFDHGAQYFTARGEGFQQFLAPFIAAGTVATWQPRLSVLGGSTAPVWMASRYVALPGMNGLCKAMAAQVDVATGVEIQTLAKAGGAWTLSDKDGQTYGGFDWVISTAPAVQTQRLMPDGFTGQAALHRAKMSGCYSLMLGYNAKVSLPWAAAQVVQGPLSWIAVNSDKPGRDTPDCILCQTSNDWAESNLERDQGAVKVDLLSAFDQATGLDGAAADYVSLHRWRYARGSPF